MIEQIHMTKSELESGLDAIRQSPRDEGALAMIVRRPDTDEREVIDQAELDLVEGLVGDNWKTRGSSRTKDGSANPEAQITIMSARAIALIAQDKERWPLAGDQLYIDLDLSEDNLPAGSQIALGSIVLQVSTEPHTGCSLFVERFGMDAVQFVNSPEGRRLRLRGVNAKITQPGVIQIGDVATILSR